MAAIEELSPSDQVQQFNGDFSTDFLSVDQLSGDDLQALHNEADIMRFLAHKEGVAPILKESIYNLVFWNSGSTRTKYSFIHAIERLGGRAIDFHQETSSGGTKGETFEDTVEMLDAYMTPNRDGFIIRHNETGKVGLAASIADAKVVNAGDGNKGEHPTQGVLDTKTIKDNVPRLDEAYIGFFGDNADARTVNSTAPLLEGMGVKRMAFIAPHGELAPSRQLITRLKARGVEVVETDDIREVSKQLDIIYALRTQYEAKPDQIRARELFVGRCLLTPENLRGSKALIMHPLPQDQTDLNIHPLLRQDPRCIVKEQAANGEWTRMALLARMAGKSTVAARAAEIYGYPKPTLTAV